MNGLKIFTALSINAVRHLYISVANICSPRMAINNKPFGSLAEHGMATVTPLYQTHCCVLSFAVGFLLRAGLHDTV